LRRGKDRSEAFSYRPLVEVLRIWTSQYLKRVGRLQLRSDQNIHRGVVALFGFRMLRKILENLHHDLVFPTVKGNVRDPRNTSRDWHQASERLGYPDVTSHSFRKTVATALDQAGMTAREIAEYLGHENPSITQDVYMAKNINGLRAAKALETVVGGK